MSDVKKKFEAGAAAVLKAKKDPGNDLKLKLYAHYKQATEGDVKGEKPGFTDFVNRAKYEACAKLKGMGADDAMKAYVKLVERVMREQKKARGNLRALNILRSPAGAGARRRMEEEPRCGEGASPPRVISRCGARPSSSRGPSRAGALRARLAPPPPIRARTLSFRSATWRASSSTSLLVSTPRKVAGDTALARVFLVNGRAPEPGTLLVQQDLAATLRTIAQGGADALYRGPLSQRISAFMEREGGLLVRDDLVRHQSQWQEPLATTYLGKTVLAFPQISQGMPFLQMLNLAEAIGLDGMARNSAEYIHALVEGAKLAYGDRDRFLADPAFTPVLVERLLSKEYAREQARRIRRDSVAAPAATSGLLREGNGDH